MGRMTRAKAAVVAEQLHVDEDAVLEANENDVAEAGGAMKTSPTATPSKSPRPPLSAITPNSGDGKTGASSDVVVEEETGKKSKGKKKTKNKNGNKNAGLGASTNSQVEVLADEQEAGEEEGEADGSELPTNDDLSQSTSTPPLRLTRSHLAQKAELEEDEGQGETTEEITKRLAQVDIRIEQDEAETGKASIATPSTLDAPASPLPSATPNVIANLRKETPGKRSASNKENMEPLESPELSTPMRSASQLSPNYDALEAAAVQAATPPISRRASSVGESSDIVMSQTEEQIETSRELNETFTPIDVETKQAATEPEKIEDAVEPVEAESVQGAVAEKVTAETTEAQVVAEKPKVRAKKPAPVVRGTKASQARLSLAVGDKNSSTAAPALGRPRVSAALGRSNSVRQSYAPEHKRGLSTSTRAPPGALNKEKKEVVIPHSKPRPVSVSFPTPPPAAKSTKAPTKSTFQLPGDAIAAKLKAQREERTKKETEEAQKRPVFKARPAPPMSKTAPVVRHTNASKSRESVKDLKSSATIPAHKRASSVFTSSTKNALKEAVTGAKIAVRPSTAMATVHKSRGSVSVATAITAPASGQRVPSGKGTVRGKEVFNRAANAREAAEKEKREKEEAAKKARVAASERGRQLSREWAEKQRQKKSTQKTAAAEGTVAPVSEVA